MRRCWIVIFLIVILDQILKIWVKTTMALGELIPVCGDWFNVYFIENNGMAFGWQFSELPIGKILLVLLRLVAIVLLILWLKKLAARQTSTGPLIGVSLVTAGAIGNSIDCLFYGLVFNESTFTQVATFMPSGGGYSHFMLGRVVDMLYFPLFTIPDWVPGLGGQIFFSPIFNLADSAITIGVLFLLIFHWKWLKKNL